MILDNFGEEVKIVPCICCWYDLLGFGAPFMAAQWDLHKEAAASSIKRIITEAEYFSGLSSTSYGKKMHLNDGIISNYDIDTDTSFMGVLLFLDAIIADFDSLNWRDQANGYPGVRGVITCGQRVCYDHTNLTHLVNTDEDTCYHPREFQMNTAFSKAFLVEESGSKAGIAGPSLYIDFEIFGKLRSYAGIKIMEQAKDSEIIFVIEDNTKWMATLTFDLEAIPYQHHGIDTIFYRLKSSQTIIGEYAKMVAHQQAQRYSQWDDED